jgi:hypothetical protein
MFLIGQVNACNINNLKKENSMKKESLKDMCLRVAKRVNFHQYRSQPLPIEYSKTVRYSIGTPQPSQMQQAFINAIV